MRYFGQIIHRLSEQIQAALGVLSTRAQENLTGIRVVRAYVQEKPEIAAFDDANREYVNRNIKLIGSWSLFFPALSAMIGVTVVILLGMGGTQRDRRPAYRSALFPPSTHFLIQLVFPMIAIGWVTNIFQRGAASMGRLKYILTAEPGICDASSAQFYSLACRRRQRLVQPRIRSARTQTPGESSGDAESAIHGEIEFRHLTFAYPTARRTAAADSGAARHQSAHSRRLHARDRRPHRQRKIHSRRADRALVGSASRTPCSSTAARSANIRSTHLRRAIGYVPQDTFSSAKRLRENIAFGVADAVEEHVLEAAEIASISGEIQELPAALRHHGRRARHHAFRRPEAAHLPGARHSAPAQEF